jgi:glycosyltransferase involved in cell wall biosynthesis
MNKSDFRKLASDMHQAFVPTSDIRHPTSVPDRRSVLLICHSLPPYEYSGTPLVTRDYALGLQGMGYRVGVMIPNLTPAESPGPFKIEEQEGVRIYRVMGFNQISLNLGSAFLKDMTLLQPVKEVLQEFKPDFAHVVDYVFLPPQVLQVASDSGAIVMRHAFHAEELCLRVEPCLAELSQPCTGPTSPAKCARCITQYIQRPDRPAPWDEGALEGNIQAWRQYIQFLYDRVVDGVFFASSVFQRFFAQFLRVPEHKMFLVPHGIRPPRSMPAPTEADKPVTFCFIGSTVIRKGIELLSHAFRNIDPDLAQLLIYGYYYDPALVQELTSIPCVKHRGAFDDIDEIMAEVDVGLVPSYFEGYSRVLREFLSRGRPVIATKFFGSEIVADSSNGFLIDIGDQEALRERVAALIADRALLCRLKHGAAATAVPTLDEEIRSIHGVYQLLWERKRGIDRIIPEGNPES